MRIFYYIHHYFIIRTYWIWSLGKVNVYSADVWQFYLWRNVCILQGYIILMHLKSSLILFRMSDLLNSSLRTTICTNI